MHEDSEIVVIESSEHDGPYLLHCRLASKVIAKLLSSI
jgi:hypothetical protein